MIETIFMTFLWIGAIYCGLAMVYCLMGLVLDLLGYDLTITRR